MEVQLVDLLVTVLAHFSHRIEWDAEEYTSSHNKARIVAVDEICEHVQALAALIGVEEYVLWERIDAVQTEQYGAPRSGNEERITLNNAVVAQKQNQ